MANIFITGATGFLGSLLIDEILSNTKDTVHALVRDKGVTPGRRRLISLLEDLRGGKKLGEKTKNRIKTYTGNITHNNLGLAAEAFKELAGNIDMMYHTAAATSLNSPLAKVRKANVEGTKNLLDFAALCAQKGRLKKVNHVSTAYVAGTKRCVFKESDLDIGQDFNNTYEQSKFEAEKLIHEYRKKGLDIDIFRPAIMMGRLKDGKTTNFKMFYQPLHFFSLELFERIPACEDSRANVINIDTVAKAIAKIAGAPNGKNMCYHIVSPNTPNFKFVLDVATDFFGFRKPGLVKLEDIDMRAEYSAIKRKMIEPYLPYFNYFTEFTMENGKARLEKEGFEFPELDRKNLTRLFEYCAKTGFIKRKKNVVAR